MRWSGAFLIYERKKPKTQKNQNKFLIRRKSDKNEK